MPLHQSWTPSPHLSPLQMGHGSLGTIAQGGRPSEIPNRRRKLLHQVERSRRACPDNSVCKQSPLEGAQKKTRKRKGNLARGTPTCLKGVSHHVTSHTTLSIVD